MSRMLNMLGLCARARALITGEKACVQQIRSGGAYVAILDKAAAKNAVKSISDACEYHQVSLVWTPEFALGDAIGKPGRMAAIVTEEKMAQRIIELYQLESK